MERYLFQRYIVEYSNHIERLCGVSINPIIDSPSNFQLELFRKKAPWNAVYSKTLLYAVEHLGVAVYTMK